MTSGVKIRNRHCHVEDVKQNYWGYNRNRIQGKQQRLLHEELPMRWMYFIDHYDNWSDSTQKKHISELEDMGTASQIAEACNYLCDDEVAGALVRKAIKKGVIFSAKDILALDGVLDDSDMESVIRNSLKAGVSFSFEEIEGLCGVVDDSLFSEIVDEAIRQGIVFTPDQVDWMIGNVDEAVLAKAVKSCKEPFSRDQLENIDGEIDDDLLQDICKKQGIDLYEDDAEEDGEVETDDNDGTGRFQPVRTGKPKKRHGGLLTFLVAMSGLSGSKVKTGQRFHIGDHVRVRYRGQEGTIIDINDGLYLVSLSDGKYVDSFEEGDLEKAR